MKRSHLTFSPQHAQWLFLFLIFSFPIAIPLQVFGQCDSPPIACSGDPAVPGQFVEGNPDLCPGGFRIDPVETGSTTSPDGFEVWINVSPDGKSFSWCSNYPISEIVVKGGSDALIYTYDPPSCGDNGCLVAPDNCGSEENPILCGLSHMDFCYDFSPSLICPVDVTVDCADSKAPEQTGYPTLDPASCYGAAYTFADQVIPGNCPGNYTIDRTFTTTAFGDPLSCMQTITVKDDSAPALICPANKNVDCTQSTDPSNTGMGTATDDCSGETITHSDVTIPGNCAGNYTIARSWSATDACGNMASCVQLITVSDNNAPILNCPADVDLDCTESTAPSHTGMGTATDDCSGATVTYADVTTPGNCAGNYTITRTWTATDGCGNSASCDQLITVTDQNAPTISCPANSNVSCGGSTEPASTGMATAMDNCSGASVTHSDVITFGPCTGNKSIQRTWIAMDGCGNTSTCMQTVTINDCGSLELLKLTNGAVNPGMNWSFNAFTGGYGGTLIASASTLNDGNGILFENIGLLSAGIKYTICEVDVPAGWSGNWKIDTNFDGVADQTIIPYNPDFNPNPALSQDLGNRCFDIGYGTAYPLPLGQTGTDCTLVLEVNNATPGGEPRTPGYWKNWNTCTNGNQQQTAQNNGGPAAGWYLLDDILTSPGISWCDFNIATCEDGVSILDQRDLDSGKKRASDAAYTLAMHLLAAQLNFAAGAQTCQAALDAADAAEALLCNLDFDGTGTYLRPNNAEYSYALCLATCLDQYNNGFLCPGGSCNCSGPLMANWNDQDHSNRGDDVAISPLIEVEVYPNPSSAEVMLNIRSQVESGRITVEIFNMTGQRVFRVVEAPILENTQATVRIPENTLPAGLYLYRVTDGTQVTQGQMRILD